MTLLNSKNAKVIRLISLGFVSLSMVACSGDKIESEAKYPSGYDRTETQDDIYGERKTVFGEGSVFSVGRDKSSSKESGITVNKYLWRAALDTVSFMPLASADPFGGVILTDWYSPPESPNERFKLNVFILDGKLRSDGVRVKVFSQKKTRSGWEDDKASEKTARTLEDTILTRARQIRVSQRSLDE